MNRKQLLIRIEKIWEKHATGKRNMIATFLPHANQAAMFKELADLFDEITPYSDPVTIDSVRKAVNDVIQDEKIS